MSPHHELSLDLLVLNTETKDEIMKNLLVILLMAFVAQFARADCASTGIYVFPESKEIHINSIFTIEGYALDQVYIQELEEKYTAFLLSESEKIELRLIEQFDGMFSMSKAILKPSSPLKMGSTYTLEIYDNQNHEIAAFMKRYNSDIDEFEKISWTVTKEEDRKVPVWTKMPTHDKNLYTAFGCGPAIYSIFSTQVTDLSAVLVWTDLKDITTGEIYSYYIPVQQDSIIQIGHGMCSGQFSFVSKHEYEVRFKLMDECGNYGTGTLWYKFDNPVDHYESY